jgi:molybdenum cofactor cytidylyltransferase
MRVFALLPAGGTSSRMGRPKLALDLCGKTVLERVIDTVRAANVLDILVVLGPSSTDLQPIADKAGARTLLLDRQTPDMRATIEHGLRWLIDNEQPRPDDWLLLLPADHPALSSACIEDLLRASLIHGGGATIWVPTYEGRRGHPALMSWSHVPGILAAPADQGLNKYLRTHADATMEVPCLSGDILCDLDTPADYERLRRMFT